MSVGLYSGVSGLALGTGLYRNVSGLWGGSPGLISGFGGGNPFGGASLYLNFLSGSLDSRVGFSRGTNATMVDSTGRIVYAPANLLVRSQEFDNAAWTKTAATITANSTTAPDGTTTADKFVESSDASPTLHILARTGTVLAGFGYVVSVYAKAAERTQIAIQLGSAVSYYNLSNGTIVSGTGSIIDAGNGWYRCVLATASAANSTCAFYTAVSGSATYTGNGTSGIFVWGAQLEPVTYQTAPGPYVATTASAYYGPRFDYNPFTLGALGLLIEEQRTNLLTWSEDFTNAVWTKGAGTSVTANATTAPDGTTTADRWIKDSGTTGAADLYRDMVVAALNTAHSFSFYAKANGIPAVRVIGGGSYSPNGLSRFNLELGTVAAGTGAIQSVGNGWYRCTVFITRTGTSDNAVYIAPCNADGTFPVGDGTSGIFIWGAQLEVGAFATSYIPTVASQVTRNADVASMTGTNFSGWYNQPEGTFVMDGDTAKPTTLVATAQILSASDGTVNNNHRVRFITAGIDAVTSVGGVTQVDMTEVGYAVNVPSKVAYGYLLNDYGFTVNGGTVQTDTSATVPTVNSLQLGSDPTGFGQINGHVRQIAYFNTRLPNAQLQTLSSPSLVPTLVLDFTASSYASGY